MDIAAMVTGAVIVLTAVAALVLGAAIADLQARLVILEAVAEATAGVVEAVVTKIVLPDSHAAEKQITELVQQVTLLREALAAIVLEHDAGGISLDTLRKAQKLVVMTGAKDG